MPPVGFEPTISAGEWPQTYALDRAATGTGSRQKVTRGYLPVKGLVQMCRGNATSQDLKSELNTADTLHLRHIHRQCVGNKQVANICTSKPFPRRGKCPHMRNVCQIRQSREHGDAPGTLFVNIQLDQFEDHSSHERNGWVLEFYAHILGCFIFLQTGVLHHTTYYNKYGWKVCGDYISVGSHDGSTWHATAAMVR